MTVATAISTAGAGQKIEGNGRPWITLYAESCCLLRHAQGDVCILQPHAALWKSDSQNMCTNETLLCTSGDVKAGVATLHIILKMQQHNLCRPLACLHGEPVVQRGLLPNTSLEQVRTWSMQGGR